MDSGPVKPARRWSLLPTRRAGDPANAPVSPTDHVNPIVPGIPPGAADSQGRRRNTRSVDRDDADESDGTGRSSEHKVDRNV